MNTSPGPRVFGLLKVFLANYADGYKLEVCSDPHGRPDARGINAQAGRTCSTARLCENRVIAITPDYDYPVALVHAIAHEVGHQEAEDERDEFHNEEAVAMNQIAVLDHLVAALLGAGGVGG